MTNTAPTSLFEQFSTEDIETLIATASELLSEAIDPEEYLSSYQLGLTYLARTRTLGEFSIDEIEALLSTAGELYDNANNAHEFLSVRQQGLASLAAQRRQELMG